MRYTQDRAFEILDVSHAIGAGTETYPGLPPPRFSSLLDYEASRPRYAGGPESALDALRGEQGYFHAAPVAWRGGATFPVRAYVLRRATPSRAE